MTIIYILIAIWLLFTNIGRAFLIRAISLGAMIAVVALTVHSFKEAPIFMTIITVLLTGTYFASKKK